MKAQKLLQKVFFNHPKICHGWSNAAGLKKLLLKKYFLYKCRVRWQNNVILKYEQVSVMNSQLMESQNPNRWYKQFGSILNYLKLLVRK